MNRILTRLADSLPYNTGRPAPIINTPQMNPQSTGGNGDVMNQPADPAIVAEISKLLDRIKSASNGLKDIYYSLFDNLNALYATYPSIYKQLQMTVKLPTNNDAMNVVTMNNDLTQALERFKDPIYLNSYISNSAETL